MLKTFFEAIKKLFRTSKTPQLNLDERESWHIAMLKNDEILCKLNKDGTIEFYCKVSINKKAIEQLLKKQSPDGFKVIWIQD